MNKIITQTKPRGGHNDTQNALRITLHRFKAKTKVLRTKLLEDTMQKTESTLEETERETLTTVTLKIAVVIITLMSFLIKQ